MKFDTHSSLVGQHSALSASTYSWVNYDDEKFQETYRKRLDAAMGTRLHAFAKEAIELRQKMPDTSKTLNLYINDCIGYRMICEQLLFYSFNAFCTADAIRFSDNKLMVFDLKTGVTPASMKQLYVYVAYFCLEYDKSPFEIEIELRIYQNDDVIIEVPELHDIVQIMEQIKRFDAMIEKMKAEVTA